jgi:AraC-like DNA-binding protein
MRSKSRLIFMDEPFWEKYDGTTANPFDVEAGPFPKEIQNRLDIHYAIEIGIVMEGRVRRFCGDHTQDVDPGQIWLCGPWERHSRKTLKRPTNRVVLHVLPQTLAGSSFWPMANVNFITPFMVAPNYRPQTAPEDRDKMIQIGRLLEWVHRHGPAHQKNVFYLLFLEIALLLAMRSWNPPESHQFQRSSSDFLKISPAVHLVLDSQKRIAEKQAAGACGLSSKAFKLLFENMMGTTFGRFVLQYRLYRAARKLLESDDLVKQIADQWGFTDISHLNRAFIKQYGCTARNFRNRHVDSRYYQISAEE